MTKRSVFQQSCRAKLTAHRRGLIESTEAYSYLSGLKTGLEYNSEESLGDILEMVSAFLLGTPKQKEIAKKYFDL